MRKFVENAATVGFIIGGLCVGASFAYVIYDMMSFFVARALAGDTKALMGAMFFGGVILAGVSIPIGLAASSKKESTH